MDRLNNILNRQREFQKAVGFPIDSITESDRNEMSEKYIFKLIEEAVELRKEFPSVVNPWSKKQKVADLQRIREEFSDVLLFLMNLSLVWRLSTEDLLYSIEFVQNRNFEGLKKRKMDLLNADILKIPGRISGVGQGNLTPKYVFIGQNPGTSIDQGYEFWSKPNDGSSKVLLPALDHLEISHDCYFTNLVKCTTPNNEEPTPDLAKFYLDFLETELEILKISNPDMKIITMGKWTDSAINSIPHFPIPHPAAVQYGSVDMISYVNLISQAIK